MTVKKVEPEKMIVKEEEVQKQPEMATLIRLEEFLSSAIIRRSYRVESLGGFVSWVGDKSPRKLPFENWQKLLEEFLHRIL